MQELLRNYLKLIIHNKLNFIDRNLVTKLIVYQFKSLQDQEKKKSNNISFFLVPYQSDLFLLSKTLIANSCISIYLVNGLVPTTASSPIALRTVNISCSSLSNLTCISFPKSPSGNFKSSRVSLSSFIKDRYPSSMFVS